MHTATYLHFSVCSSAAFLTAFRFQQLLFTQSRSEAPYSAAVASIYQLLWVIYHFRYSASVLHNLFFHSFQLFACVTYLFYVDFFHQSPQHKNQSCFEVILIFSTSLPCLILMLLILRALQTPFSLLECFAKFFGGRPNMIYLLRTKNSHK